MTNFFIFANILIYADLIIEKHDSNDSLQKLTI